MRPLIFVILIIAGLAALKIYVWDKPEATSESTGAGSANRSPGAQGALPVNVYVAEAVQTDNTVYASGTVVPNEEVELKSEVSGRLIQLNIREGSYVKKGQLIAKLNDNDLKAQLKKLEFEDQLATQIEARQKKLLDINAISKEEYDLAMNKVNLLGADREILQVQLEKTEVRAPFSGYIGFKNISVGAYITPNVIIANLVQTNPVKIDFEIPEKYSSEVEVTQETYFEIDGIKDKFVAKVIAIDPSVDEDLRTLGLRALADNKLGLFRPGMFVRVELPLGSRKAIMVPTESILPILKGKIVYLMKNGKASETKVTTGLRTDRSVQIIDGMEIGDSVIVSALMTLKANLPVKVQEVVTLGDAP